MIGNKNKSKTTKTPLVELQNLQSELHSLREKHIAALESELLLLEKEEVSQKSRIDKAREQLNQAKLRLKDLPTTKASVQARAQASLDTHQTNFDKYQADLAQIRSKIFEQKLAIRKERAVLKAIIDAEKELKKPEKSTSSSKKDATTAATPDVTPKPTAKKAAEPSSAQKPAPNAKPSTSAKTRPASPAATKKSTVQKTENKVAAEPSEAKNTDTAKKDSPSPAAETVKTAKEAAVKQTAIPTPPPTAVTPPPKRRVRRMSDIPSHPDKAGDRLASLFDDF